MRTYLLIVLLCLARMAAGASVPIGGLAVAVTPDGKTIAMAGDNRTLYVIDAATLEVKQRVWVQTSVVSMAFNKDGTKLIAEDVAGDILLIESAGWKVENHLPKAEGMAAAPLADVYAGRSGRDVSVYSMTDGSVKAKATIDSTKSITLTGISGDGKKIAVLAADSKDTSEARNTTVPKELSGLAAEEFLQKNDGRVSFLYLFDAATGAKQGEFKLFYDPGGGKAKMFFNGDNVEILTYKNVNASIAKDGAVKLYQTANSFNYGIGISADQKTFATGDLRDGTYGTVANMNQVTLNIASIPGWPEYFKDFAIGADGTAYGSTSAYRLVKIKPDGTSSLIFVDKTVPVH